MLILRLSLYITWIIINNSFEVKTFQAEKDISPDVCQSPIGIFGNRQQDIINATPNMQTY